MGMERICLEYESRLCRVPLNAGRPPIARFRQTLALVPGELDSRGNRPGEADRHQGRAKPDKSPGHTIGGTGSAAERETNPSHRAPPGHCSTSSETNGGDDDPDARSSDTQVHVLERVSIDCAGSAWRDFHIGRM